jgi:hypothetical protein
MVTLYYMRRYITFLQQLLAKESGSFSLSREVDLWLTETAAALSKVRPLLQDGPLSGRQQYQLLVALGEASSRYRQTVYRQESFTGKAPQPLDQITAMLDDALAVVDHSIQCNVREDGLYHAYNLLEVKPEAVEIDGLYPMLEGQVAALSSGAIAPAQAVEVLETLFASKIYRKDQHSFMLYPDRELPTFLEKNQIPTAAVEAIPLLNHLLEQGEDHIVVRDAEGCYRFNANFKNVHDLNTQLDALVEQYGAEIEEARQSLTELYEQVFNHNEFTGRSGGMFGFEGLGSIYWHMVSKLLLAAQENFFVARTEEANETTCHRLGILYYRVREGIGFNKTPEEYGAFPTDPYSHTPRHAGAKQPGMTGQVKEEILTRFGELGVRVSAGAVQFDPSLLRAREFVTRPQAFRFLDVDEQWQQLDLPESALAFTWCQVPIVYHLQDSAAPAVTVVLDDGSQQTLPGLALPTGLSEQLFLRSGHIRRIEVVLGRSQLFSE